MRFTIRSLMIAVAVVAVPLAGLQSFSGDWQAAVLSVAFACLAWIGAEWLNFRGKRALAAICFGGIAALFNVLYPAVCICPDSYLLIALWLAWFFMIAPLLIALGAAWARLATAKTAMSRRSPVLAWLLVARSHISAGGHAHDTLATASLLSHLPAGNGSSGRSDLSRPAIQRAAMDRCVPVGRREGGSCNGRRGAFL